jgi:hypothetical protein
VAPDGVDCEAADPSALRFYAGAPSVEKMTLNVEAMCGDSGSRASVIGFYSDAEDCANGKTMFGNVDRVVISGPGSSATDMLIGVTMSRSSQCEDIVLGTLKVNRSVISGLSHGVISSLGGAGQVDINFNEFSDMGTSIAVVNANQGSSITGNTITYNDAENYAGIAGFGSVGILVGGDSGAPAENLTSIKRNTFINGDAGSAGYAILVGQEAKKVKHTVWVSSNKFDGVEPAASSSLARGDLALTKASLLSYRSDFESFDALFDWSAWISVFDETCTGEALYGYSYSIGAGDPVQVAVRADGSTGKALNVFSDYNNADSASSCLEANVFREVTLTAGMIGTYRWSFDVEEPEAVGSKTFGQFRLIDPSNNYI